jgi:hypothetical protein
VLLNWTECEKAIHEILMKCAEGNAQANDWEAFIAEAESAIASFINEHFGLKPDKPTASEVSTVDHG